MSVSMVSAPTEARAFMLAGKAVFTAKSLNTGAHMTFKVKAAKKPGTVTHFVYVRDGSPGDSKFPYLGTLNAEGVFRVGHPDRTPFNDSSRQAIVFKFLAEGLRRDMISENVEIWHEGRCGRCGRALTHPDSIASGIGPECARKADR